MSLTVYDTVYIICNLFNTYVVAKLMRVFYDKETANLKIEICSYLGYFAVTTFFYLFINVPIIMLVCNIFLLFLVSYNYQVSIKTRIFCIIFVYLLLMLIEELIALLSGYSYNSMFTVSNYSSIWGVILIKVISFIIVVILEKNKNKKQGMDIPIIYWLCICVIPFISLYLIFILFQKQDLSNSNLIISIFILLFENIVVFYLYDVIFVKLENKAEHLLLQQQNQFYCKQLSLMQMSLQSTRETRHDLKNHLSTIQALAKKEEVYSILYYIDKMNEKINFTSNFSNSNNVVIDSIINFKCEEALKYGITVDTDIKVPNELYIESFDLTVILGNLIDNAIQAVKIINESKNISIKIKYDKGRLLIKIVNSYKGVILLKNNLPETTNIDKNNHGIGLKNIIKTLEQYKGQMDIQTKENIFCVNIILYTSENT